MRRGRGVTRPAPPASAQENAGQETSPVPLPNCQTPARPRSSQDTCLLDRSLSGPRTSWNPRLRLPEKAVSQWGGEKTPRTLLRRQQPEHWDPGPSVQNFIQAPRPPSGKGKPRWPGEDANWLQFVTRNCYECRKGGWGEALGVTSLGSQSGSHNPPLQFNPPPQKTPHAAPSPQTPFLKAQDNREGWEGGRRKERRGKRGGTFSGKGWVWVFYCYYFPLTCPSAEVLTSTRAAAINQSDRRTITSRVHFSTTGQSKCPEQTPPQNKFL